MSNAVRILTGVESVRAAEEYRLALQDRRDQWPYVHIYPPPTAIDVNAIGTALTGTQGGAAVQVVSYQVNSGKRFYLHAVLFSSNVSPFQPGDAFFTVDRNSPLGVTNAQFMPEHGLVNVPIQLGSASFAPWKLHRSREFGPLDTVRIKASNINLPEGTPNTFVCGLFGYEVPSLDVKPVR